MSIDNHNMGLKLLQMRLIYSSLITDY